MTTALKLHESDYGPSAERERFTTGTTAVKSDTTATPEDQRREERPDIVALMAQIRARVAADAGRVREGKRPFKATTASIDGGAERRAGELLHSEELRTLNLRHAYSKMIDPHSITSHRAGVVGKLVLKVKRKLLAILRDSLLREYLAHEHEFHSNLVRYLNELTRYVDNRDASNFWELVRKIDVDTTKALDRIERINDEQMGSIRSSETRLFETINATAKEMQSRLTALEGRLNQEAATVRSVDGAVKGLEAIAAHFNGADSAPVSGAGATAQGGTSVERTYLLFENRFRGSEEEVHRRQVIYPELFAGVDAPVLEIGPGRGELQSLLKQHRIASYGIDTDAAMVQAARAHGFDIRLGDGIAHLADLPDHSLGGLIAIQVVEHLPYAVLRDLISRSAKKVKRGGRVVFETINPQSMLALSSNYFRDPTHEAPLHPDTLRYMMEVAGFTRCEVRYLSPVPESALLKEIPLEEYMTPRWSEVIERMNHNVRQLNTLLYGYQDFCIIGEVA